MKSVSSQISSDHLLLVLGGGGWGWEVCLPEAAVRTGAFPRGPQQRPLPGNAEVVVRNGGGPLRLLALATYWRVSMAGAVILGRMLFPLT